MNLQIRPGLSSMAGSAPILYGGSAPILYGGSVPTLRGGWGLVEGEKPWWWKYSPIGIGQKAYKRLTTPTDPEARAEAQALERQRQEFQSLLERPPQERRRLPAWAVIGIVLGAVFLLGGGGAAVAASRRRRRQGRR